MYLSTTEMIKLHNYYGNISYLQNPYSPKRKLKKKKKYRKNKATKTKSIFLK